jgi:methionyl-tRNA formyltransferase
VLVVVAYGLILPRAVLDLPRLGCLNIHASLLPRWRGAAPIQRALLAGDAETGVSIMKLEEGLDTGPVYAERRLRIDSDDTAGVLQTKLALMGVEVLIEVLAALAAGHVAAATQSEQGVSYAHKIKKDEAAINWHQDATAIARQISAFNPWPVAESTLSGERIRIWRAHAVKANEDAAAAEAATMLATACGRDAGSVLQASPQALYVACGGGVLAISELQAPGRRVVNAGEFARGRSAVEWRFQ